MEPNDVISLLAVAIAFFAFAVAMMSFRLNRRIAIANKQPSIVFEYDEQVGWKVRNIGKGPALNIKLAVRGKETKWEHHILVQSLREGCELTPPNTWVAKNQVWMLSATYEDSDYRYCTIIAQHTQNKILDGHVLEPFEEYHKDYFPRASVKRYWSAPPISKADLNRYYA